MSAQLEIRFPGVFASVQDRGRFGYRRIGVPWSGVLDPGLMRIGNRLVGNENDHPVIECFDGAQQLRAEAGALRLAVAGHASLEIENERGHHPVAAWRSFLLEQGETLRISRVAPNRIVVVAVAGLSLPAALGSVSTYARAGLGGGSGRALAAGDRIPAAAAVAGCERVLLQPPALNGGPIRLIGGPQQDHFTEAAWATLLSSEYRISRAADRMGMRLDGPVLDHAPGYGLEIVSDATVPGAIQVPGNGQPIVLLADAQTAGGYPKIATVISADLPRLAARRPGEAVRFAAVTAYEGEQLARLEARRIVALLDQIDEIDEIDVLPDADSDFAALYSCNLIDGVFSAQSLDQ